MKILALLVLTLSLRAEGPDLKRNQRVQKKAAHVLAAQADYNGEMKAWLAECEAKGLTLAPVAGNLMDCVVKQQPQAQTQRRPLATPAEPSSKVAEQPSVDEQQKGTPPRKPETK